MGKRKKIWYRRLKYIKKDKMKKLLKRKKLYNFERCKEICEEKK